MDIKKIKENLIKEKEEILEQLKRFAEKEGGIENNWKASFPQFNGSSSMEEEADEVEEYATRLSLEFNLETRLKEIDRAIERIEKGTYGICEKCKTEIEEERLKANPIANLCKRCNE